MTPQEVRRVAFPCNEQHSDVSEKHSEVHGHLLEPEVIINVKQEPQVNRKFTAFPCKEFIAGGCREDDKGLTTTFIAIHTKIGS
jgi:hypothetical protein